MMKQAEQFLSGCPGERIVLCDDPRPELIRAMTGARQIALFTGRSGAAACGALEDVERAAASAGCEVRRFNAIPPEPDLETVTAMTAFLAECDPGAPVFAAGGGSVLDAAKAALFARNTGRESSAFFGVNVRSREQRPGDEGMPRIFAIPTTSGTGSEATPYSNVVDRAKQVKKLISESLIVPRNAVLVPRYAGTMPKHVVLATGCDALAHLMEGFLNVGADQFHPCANDWAKCGIGLVCRYLPRRLADPGDGEAIRGMALAATLGGMVICFKSTGLPHLCSFSWFGRIEHGIAAIMLLPASWEFYLGNPAVEERTRELAEFFPGKTPEEIIASFRGFLARLGVPGKLAEFPGITPELLAATAASGSQNRMKLELAPRPVPLERSREILSEILQKTYEGR